MDYEALEDLARKCTESKLSELKDTDYLDILMIDIVETSNADLSDAEVDTVTAYCGKFADALLEALYKVSVR